MKKEDYAGNCCENKMIWKHHCGNRGGDQGAIYGLGVVGALFYFLQNASGLGMVLVGIGKAVFLAGHSNV